MQISVKLLGHLVDLLPPSGKLGLERRRVTPLEIDDDTDLAALIAHIGLPANVEYFAMINEEHVPADALAMRELAEGDAVVLLPPLKGG